MPPVGLIAEDERWMAQALDLAREGIGRASPNPTVGCVLVRDGRRVGAGFHEYDRRDHAEIVALQEAGALAQGATAYVTLEPCSHHGRTGPCADALIAAGVTRVVIATADANPTVHGHGITRIRDAGIAVDIGLLQEPARRINDSFAKWIRTGLPHVTLKVAMSLDGRIAPPPDEQRSGEISWITGSESREQVQQIRHSVDAVLTGAGTALADDPVLTDRSGMPRRRALLRVVLDSQLRLPVDSKLVQSAAGDLLIFCTEAASKERRGALIAAGASVVALQAEAGDVAVPAAAVLKYLAGLQVTSVLIEAGSRINSALLNGALVDRLMLFYAPHFLGPAARPMLGSRLLRQPQLGGYELHRYGADFAVESRLVDSWLP